MLVFLIHFLILFALSYRDLKKKQWPLCESILAAFVLIWLNVLLSSLLLCILSMFGNNILFLALSLALQPILLRISIHQYDGPQENSFASLGIAVKSLTGVYRLLPLYLIFLFIALALMCARLTPQIPDSLAIKLPNVFFYLQKGNVFPATEFSDDGRLFNVPFSGVFIWSYLIRFHQSAHLIQFFSFLSWNLIFLTIFKISRTLKVSSVGSLMAAALFCASQCLLFQAYTDNDDLIGSVMGTISALYAIRWLQSASWNWANLGAFALGICLGHKFFPALFAPAFIALAFYLLWVSRHTFGTVIKNRWRQFLLICIVSVGLFSPYPYVIKKTQPDSVGVSQVFEQGLNSPFRFEVLAHNFLVYNSQLLFSPLIDVFMPRGTPVRQSVSEKLNSFWLDHLLPKVENYWAYAPGVKIFHPRLYDNTVWYGHVSFLILASVLLVFFKVRNPTAIWLVLFFIAWDISFSGRSKYIEELGRYWILPISLVVPLIGLLWDESFKSKWTNRAKDLSFKYVWLCTIILSATGLGYNETRSDLRNVARKEANIPKLSPLGTKVLSECPKINFTRTVYGFGIYFPMYYFRGTEFAYFPQLKNEYTNLLIAVNVDLAHQFFEQKYLMIDLGKPTNGDFTFVDSTFYRQPFYALDLSVPKCNALSELNASGFLAFKVVSLFNKSKNILETSVEPVETQSTKSYEYRILLVDQEEKERIVTDWAQAYKKTFDIIIVDRYLRIQARELGTNNAPVVFGQLDVGALNF